MVKIWLKVINVTCEFGNKFTFCHGMFFLEQTTYVKHGGFLSTDGKRYTCLGHSEKLSTNKSSA